MKLSKTEPRCYYEILDGELWFELFHTCPVDSRQAEDFAIEGKSLYEYAIPQTNIVFDRITTEGYEKRIKTLMRYYQNYGIKGILISNSENYKNILWKRKKETNNMVAHIGNNVITITKSQYSDRYVFYLDGWRSEYNQRPFLTEEDAMKNAQYIVFEKINSKGGR